MTGMEVLRDEEQFELVKPRTRSLFETIQCLLKLAHMRRIGLISETTRLLHEDSFR